MTQKEKLIKRLAQKPKDFTWDELVTLLRHLGYEEVKQGKTAGSRRRFIHPDAAWLSLHRPHPTNVLKGYQVNQVIETLQQEGFL